MLSHGLHRFLWSDQAEKHILNEKELGWIFCASGTARCDKHLGLGGQKGDRERGGLTLEGPLSCVPRGNPCVRGAEETDCE